MRTFNSWKVKRRLRRTSEVMDMRMEAMRAGLLKAKKLKTKAEYEAIALKSDLAKERIEAALRRTGNL